ncbi:radical SAM protein [Alicyclobacillus sp. ALC3]|uniref:radical SAM protein n=1 Tax=Alicyclobacillus sp. ALC3 TaxID=2796143 RepID=UPI00237853E1|nr:radical SAM protein [Alicyclobacillus sp. ALC3]WDL95397.1 radical SAM protein [Alicyclobacillus sp. ALC3]
MQGSEGTRCQAYVRDNRLVAHVGDWLYHFDETGRLLMAAGPRQVVRRGFDNRLLQVTTPSFAAQRESVVAGAVGAAQRESVVAGAVAAAQPGVGADETDATAVGAAEPGGLMPRATAVIDPTVGALVYRAYHELDTGAAADFYRSAYGAARRTLQTMMSAADGGVDLNHEQWVEWARRLAQWSPEALATDAAAFRTVYSPISILPPDQYHSLVVQVTLGCSYNKCLFCDFYRDRRFHIRSEIELEAHLDHLMAFLGPRVADRKTVFLADGNAFVVPTERLIRMITQIRRRLSATAGASGSTGNAGTGGLLDATGGIEFNAFMDTFTLEYKTLDDLRRIYEAGLHTVYSGLETGSNRLRQFLAKPGSAEEAVEALNTLKAGGFRLGVILLVGVGGPAAADEHLADTLQALQQIKFTDGDLIYLSPFVDPDAITGYRATLTAGGFDSFTQDGLAQELVRWRRALAAMQMPDGDARPLPAKVTLYSILEHIYG